MPAPSIVINNNIAYHLAPEIRQLCEPVVQLFMVKSFSYVRINPDLSRVHLFTDPKWVEFYYKHFNQYIEIGNVTEASKWQTGFSTLFALNDPCTTDFVQHKLGDGILISNQFDGYNELCFFALQYNEESSVMIKMLNNIDLLQQFITYFREQAAPLIDQLAETPIIIKNTGSLKTVREFNFTDTVKQQFLHKLGKQQKYKITKQEYRCIELLAQDMSSKQIAVEMGIKPKTVDRHFENLKQKTGSHKRASLIQLLKFPRVD